MDKIWLNIEMLVKHVLNTEKNYLVYNFGHIFFNQEHKFWPIFLVNNKNFDRNFFSQYKFLPKLF